MLQPVDQEEGRAAVITGPRASLGALIVIGTILVVSLVATAVAFGWNQSYFQHLQDARYSTLSPSCTVMRWDISELCGGDSCWYRGCIDLRYTDLKGHTFAQQVLFEQGGSYEKIKDDYQQAYGSSTTILCWFDSRNPSSAPVSLSAPVNIPSQAQLDDAHHSASTAMGLFIAVAVCTLGFVYVARSSLSPILTRLFQPSAVVYSDATPVLVV
jgi:hypothetical protein